MKIYQSRQFTISTTCYVDRLCSTLSWYVLSSRAQSHILYWQSGAIQLISSHRGRPTYICCVKEKLKIKNGLKLTSSSLLLNKFLACARCTGNSSSGRSAFTSIIAKQYLPCILTTLPVSSCTLARTPRHWSKSPNCMPLPCNSPEGIFAVASSTVMKNSTFVQLCKPYGTSSTVPT